ncbi:hypothetical protein K3727_05460 [Rhodobacteraceae bacterium M382]|nr:hypothetical protein K3727_05460 [Rhodobacteraceae bacterium M382]
MKFLTRLIIAIGLMLATVATAQTPQTDRGQMAVNLAGVTDWGTQQPFIDVFKTARSWIGHLPRQWGGASHEDLKAADYLDANGWPVAIPPELGSIGTVILTGLPPEASSAAGRYRLGFDGNGIVEVGGRASKVRYGKNEVTFDFTPGPGSVDIRIQRTDRARKGDYVRNITVVKLDNIAAYEAGEIFNPLWLKRLEGFALLRFMDWMHTNNSTQRHWKDRPRPDDYTWAHIGVPAEIIVALANQVDTDLWITMPHLADDEYARNWAEIVKPTLSNGRRVYLEYSNEVWNWQFQQAIWADEQARARWNTPDAWLQYYAARAIEIAAIWTEVFGPEASDSLVRVLSSQTGWMGLEEQVLEAPLWRAEEPGRPRPADLFDAYAMTGYFGYMLGTQEHYELVKGWIADSLARAQKQAQDQGLSAQEQQEYVAAHRFDAAVSLAWDDLLDGSSSGDLRTSLAELLNTTLPYQADVAEKNGMQLVLYEAGSHVVGVGPMVDDPELTAFFIHLNYSPEMGLLYEELLAGWATLSDGVFTAFNDVMAPTKWGSWGALRHLDDTTARWDALEAAK